MASLEPPALATPHGTPGHGPGEELLPQGPRRLQADAGVVVAPDLEQKVQIVQNAIYVAHALGISLPLLAQEQRASIEGVARDPQGAVTPGVAVEARGATGSTAVRGVTGSTATMEPTACSAARGTTGSTGTPART